MVGTTGKVIAADLQEKMLEKTMARVWRYNFSDRVESWRCQPDKIGYPNYVDVAIAANVVHEVPNPVAFLEEVFEILKPGGMLYMTEPGIHVGAKKFENEKQMALAAGFQILESSQNFRCRRALFKRLSCTVKRTKKE
jgi:ubiquinone/menaquinone biosynthesis C-methylase UbiE